MLNVFWIALTISLSFGICSVWIYLKKYLIINIFPLKHESIGWNFIEVHR